ncbi:phospholipase D-like domain-containing protein DpdK [Variovorax sp. J22R133]|uniref:phospholipase D-like domain-containing protein DpdK n=1 Tax=Variovorax brevis TaxID=3053503 RepID=UPI0025773531|nr:phospholipase D-like domain-containing protein DpdK [Variovorax sp. J22R133]MDM0115659.1 phospholipase D-like domain-containing protein DpdK [Variovorax sp. J22R133]
MTQLGPAHSRRLFSNSGTSPSDLAELLQWMMVSELLVRSDRVWIIAPTVDNVPLLDNQTGTFDAFDPGWGRRQVRLMDLATRMAAEGTQVVVAAPYTESNAAFFKELRAAAADSGLEENLLVGTRPYISSSGILTRHGLVRGALELGMQGVRQIDDVVTFETRPDDLDRLRSQFDANLPMEEGHG